MKSPGTATKEQPLLAATRESPHSSEDPAQPKVKYINYLTATKRVLGIEPGPNPKCPILCHVTLRELHQSFQFQRLSL